MSETVLITGASSGIGRGLAELFAADRYDLVLVARGEQRLQEIAEELQKKHGVAAQALAADLSRPDAPQAVYDWLQHRSLSVDILVNNAGFGARGPVAELELERQLDMIQVNVVALTHLTRLFVRGMLERGRGGILNVASIGGFMPGPNMAVYYATKAYVLSFSEALAEELARTPVRVTCLAPGPTSTGFAAEAGMKTSRTFEHLAMTVEDVARAGYDGLRAGKVIVVPGLTNKGMVLLTRASPATQSR